MWTICRDNDGDLQSSPHSAIPGREAAVSLRSVGVQTEPCGEKLTFTRQQAEERLY